MDFITKLLAQLLDSFKAKNPMVFGIITLVLVTVQYVVLQGSELGVFAVSEFIEKVLQWITFALALLTNMGTFNILNKK